MTFKPSTVALALVLGAASSVTSVSTAWASDGCGRASWYALTSRTASGERMNPAKLTAAHRSMRFGTKVQVTNARNGKSVVVRINDRGPFAKKRIVDISRAAAEKIAMVRAGRAMVRLELLR